jgi:cob(I)alamin adenosyltransferase
VKSKKSVKGLVITYFGDGKGKTTAALGLAMRTAGYEKKVKIIQFIKGDWTSGEEKTIERLKNVSMIKTGAGFVGIENDKKPISLHRERAMNGLLLAREALGQNHSVVILDEILGAIKGKLINTREVLDLINSKGAAQTLVLTGAPKIKAIIDRSDLVTEMKKIKHPYDKGTLAIKGVDY